MEEVGLVVGVNKKKKQATVSFSRKAECEGCNMCMKHRDDMRVRCVMQNNLNAKVGDEVRVRMGTGYVLASSIIVYLIPVLLSGLSLIFTRKQKDWVSAIVFFSMLLISGIITIVLDKVVSKKSGFKPKMVAILASQTGEINKTNKEDAE